MNRMDARERPSSLVSAKEKESKILDTAHNAHCIKYVCYSEVVFMVMPLASSSNCEDVLLTSCLDRLFMYSICRRSEMDRRFFCLVLCVCTFIVLL